MDILQFKISFYRKGNKMGKFMSFRSLEEKISNFEKLF